MPRSRHTTGHSEQPLRIPDSASGDRLIDMHEVRRRIAVSRSTIWRLRKSGTFPRPASITTRVLWSAREIDAWIEERKASRYERRTA